MACVLPQDDAVITELPPLTNQPLRILPGLAVPEQRDVAVRLAANCTEKNTFSVKVEDPNVGDTIRAFWFIDPNERYVGGTLGNQGVANPGSPTLREVKAPVTFTTLLAGLTDGRKHRVEVVVTDSEFKEDTSIDPQGALTVTRANVGLPDGGKITVPAYRDDYVWVVEVVPCP
jgi:hypothetical protein